MLQSIRKTVPIPRVPALPVVSSLSILAFGWLLLSDSIHPLVVYVLQIYLAF